MTEISQAVVPSRLDEPDWFRATTLVERVRARLPAPEGSEPAPSDVERGRRRLEAWRAQPPFPSGPSFAERLAQAGLTEDDLLDLLVRTDEKTPGSHPDPPAWAMEIERAFACTNGQAMPPIPDAPPDRPEAGFLEAIGPLIGRAVARVRVGVAALPVAPSSPSFDPQTVVAVLYRPLPAALFDTMLRTMALELNVARLQGLLYGETPGQRFRSFVDRLRQPAVALALLREYPVLARQVVTRLDDWVASSLEFLRRWCADRPAIRGAFSPGEDPGPLVDLEGGLGDRHRGGRAVCVARCRSGLRVVYKPRPLAVAVHFEELLAWLNERGASPAFGPRRVLDRGDYGWEGFVAPRGCSSSDEVERFYRRQGGYLALLYALAATDYHYENLIAAGEHPVLVDLETLFHPALSPEGEDPLRDRAGVRAGVAFNESVLESGLLPQRVAPGADPEGYDLSGLGAEAGRRLPWREPAWVAAGTDAMRFDRRPGVITSSDHRPTLNGAAVDPLDHAAAIEAGFRHVYGLLEAHRDELLADGGPLDRFAGDEVRVLLRNTSRYRELLDEGSHPDVLRDALDRDRLFDRLWEGVRDEPRRARLIPAEVDDLWRGDIPYFATTPASRDLWCGGGRRFADVLGETGMDRVRRRLGQLGAAELARQLWFLRASLTTLVDDPDGGARAGYHLAGEGAAADRDRLLAASRAAGDRLAELAVRGDGDATWIGLDFVQGRRWTLLPLGTDLYDGLPGVALFLAYLGAVTGETRHTELARAALNTLRRWLLPHKRSKTVRGIGGFAGWGGILYTLAHLGVLWEEPGLFDEARDLAAILPDLIERDRNFDVIGGAAGCLAGLLCLDRADPSARVRDLALRCGDHLLSRARPMSSGLGWDPPFRCRGPLTGFSHGAAGIAWALLALAAHTGEDRYRSAALGGLTYERSLFRAEAGNWPDLRVFDPPLGEGKEAPPPCRVAWCHGAPGIGLARLRCLAHLNDPLLRPEIDAAVRTTLAHGFGRDHTLCHGDLGNLEFVSEAARAFPESRWGAGAGRLAAGILDSIARDGRLCGNPLGVESPGLMTGLAGVGYGLLRLAEPARVPSVLTLAAAGQPLDGQGS